MAAQPKATALTGGSGGVGRPVRELAEAGYDVAVWCAGRRAWQGPI